MFVLVGHCGPDVMMLRTAVTRVAPGAAIVAVNHERDLDKHLHSNAVLLVNRVLDGVFSVDDGHELIRLALQRGRRPEVVLISNYEEAQDEAVRIGARRGFGKTRLYAPETIELIRDLARVEQARPAPPG
jgi:CheY-like chemotaxis protein